ncbi:MAG TPA: alpha/beta fold hydrolase, partial [Zeimonas sp.]|nr:alpha/beta fold hydrolase [Zeimonas sp.]
MPASSYRPPPWLPGPHLQTIWPATLAPCPSIAWRRERWETPDGDFVDVDFAGPTLPGTDRGARRPPAMRAGAADPAVSGAPLLVLFHGLEGNSGSHYARALADAALRRGWSMAVPHFRGCSGELNRAPRAYHSGDSAEIDWMLRRFARMPGPAPAIAAVGVSLGGNVLLKWLGEQREAAGFVRAAVAVSPPQDLHASAVALSRGFNLVYTRHFLRTLKRKSLAKLDQFPGLYDRERTRRARDFFDFDDAVTAPLHGFSSCFDYWERSSCKPFLAGVRVPTLVINARNDPFLPAGALAARDE